MSTGLETEVKMSDVKELDIGKCSFSQILIETEGMSSSNSWGIGDVCQVSMSELTEKVGMLMVSTFIDDKFTSKKLGSEDDEPNILGNACIFDIVIITTSGSCSTFILSISI